MIFTMTFGILCSGKLGFSVLNNLFLTGKELKFVLTDFASDKVNSFCSKNDIPCFVGNPRDGRAYEFVRDHDVDVIISINYLFLINEDIINHSNLLTFNIHGSLLPKYRGRTPHVWAIINDEEEVGITAHKIELGCDTGDIIKQITIPLLRFDTGASVLKKYNSNYILLIDSVISDLAQDRLKLLKQNDNLATYYGKRTPEDGEINWEWSKRRIFNWVRAQAAPYPGAFTRYKGQKIIIDHVDYSFYGYDFRTKNGTILNIDPLIIKVCDGALELKKIRTVNVNFEKGLILNDLKNED